MINPKPNNALRAALGKEPTPSGVEGADPERDEQILNLVNEAITSKTWGDDWGGLRDEINTKLAKME